MMMTISVDDCDDDQNCSLKSQQFQTGNLPNDDDHGDGDDADNDDDDDNQCKCFVDDGTAL